MKWMMEQNRSCPCLGFHAAACNKRPVGEWVGGMCTRMGSPTRRNLPSPDEMAERTFNKVTPARTGKARRAPQKQKQCLVAESNRRSSHVTRY
ncbi:hypothetical protein CPAR01_09541 [Colletotrichum paranaense]|uniref:Uncharacterized protein n=1 Tax=Colletotrichum paranaense TaxID=1914294 RepID=A0ABQ9SH19_9PEZI|nr:uncharacterized protein CPAR01_09541 [Colletotrichum paranaense]KAK1535999.1 hypothetical protein CPAR01_09541 [Colletotrichum paranaense]